MFGAERARTAAGARACDTWREGPNHEHAMAGREPTIFEQIRKEFGFVKNISSFNESNHIRSYVCSCRAQINKIAASAQVCPLAAHATRPGR